MRQAEAVHGIPVDAQDAVAAVLEELHDLHPTPGVVPVLGRSTALSGPPPEPPFSPFSRERVSKPYVFLWFSDMACSRKKVYRIKNARRCETRRKARGASRLPRNKKKQVHFRVPAVSRHEAGEALPLHRAGASERRGRDLAKKLAHVLKKDPLSTANALQLPAHDPLHDPERLHARAVARIEAGAVPA